MFVHFVFVFGILLICDASAYIPKKCPVTPQCRPTCNTPNPKNCIYTEPPATNIDGCQCQEGYILSKTDGECIKIEECPVGCNGDPHAIAKQCPMPCPSTCDAPNALPCKRKCDPVGCECAAGYLLSKTGGMCVRPDECKGGNPCDPNEMFVQCRSGCPTDYCPVDDSLAVVICEYYPFSPCYSGCICKLNHKRKSFEDKRCIVSSDCPPVNCTRPHEIWDPCPLQCRSGYCDSVDTSDEPCYTLLLNCQPRCVCEKNYFRNSSDICVSAEECRKINSQNNATTPTPEPQCGYNEVRSDCKIKCPPQTCDSIFTSYLCPENVSCEVGCNCLDEHLRNSSGICVPSEECPTPTTPPPELQCGYNEVVSNCKIKCPPQTCESMYALYSCPANVSCEVGCDCLKGCLRNRSGICVPSNECPTTPPSPQCGYNEVYADCKITCPPQSCNNIYAVDSCPAIDSCEAGCNCLDGYLRNSSGICVPSEECPSPRYCPLPRQCRPTCAVPNPKNCPVVTPFSTNENGCQCKSGYILSDPEGDCIEIDQCPKNVGCNEDSHAEIAKCPWPCPATCSGPNTVQCKKACLAIGCQCAPGYILSEVNRKCILPDKCPYGNPCGENGTFSDCGFRCPNQYCPKDDSLTEYACKPGWPCPPGCLCKDNYKRISYEDNKCVLARDCPPVNCTRPNEEWNRCPENLVENCNDIKIPVECPDSPETNCQPRCVCTEGHCRDENKVCVPVSICED